MAALWRWRVRSGARRSGDQNHDHRLHSLRLRQRRSPDHYAVSWRSSREHQLPSLRPGEHDRRRHLNAVDDRGSTQRTQSGSTTFVPNNLDDYESSASGTATYDTYDAAGDLIGFRSGGTSYCFLHDNIGRIVAVISNTGTLSDRCSYDPYGSRTVLTSGVSQPWAFAGGFSDASTGLIKFGTRYFDELAGRWTQLDPSSINPGYAYSLENPLNESDPSGTFSISAAAEGCLAAAGQTEAFAAIAFIAGGALASASDLVGSCAAGALESIADQEGNGVASSILHFGGLANDALSALEAIF